MSMSRLSKITSFSVGLVLLLVGSKARAEDIKLGYVDMQRAINQSQI